ncbi:DUF302 domain-containing protein [Paracoccus nototheniae]|uniref:DUF302 domain-containing protein n=1 Tax=Paracoccus nototheniae TaxID=2489002 RepID=A0ABW4E0B2_9RHOB|nr:DUF302 domain-containing protein [Paracoccus nototheniae]
MRRLLASLALALGLATTAHAEDWVIKSSPHDVATTADRLEAIIDDSPATLIARVDHQAAAEGAGLQMDPATVLIFGNPQIGTPLMQADPRAALDLPLRVLVWQQGGATSVGYLSVEALAARHDLAGAAEALDAMGQALDRMTEGAVSAE